MLANWSPGWADYSPSGFSIWSLHHSSCLDMHFARINWDFSLRFRAGDLAQRQDTHVTLHSNTITTHLSNTEILLLGLGYWK